MSPSSVSGPSSSKERLDRRVLLALAVGLLVSLAVAVVALRPSTSLALRAATWRQLGPQPIDNFSRSTGRIAGIAASATNPRRYYAAGAGGGVWRTTNAGVRWISVGDDLPILAIGAIAVDPHNDRVVYAGSGEANYAFHSNYGLGMFKTRNGGRTWEVLGADRFSGRTFSRIAVSTENSDVVLAAVARAGGTFPAREATKGHPRRNGPRGIFRSQNGGRSWKRLRGGLPNQAASDIVIDLANNHRLFAAIGEIFGHPRNGVYRSTDGGESWRRLRGGLPDTSVGRISIAIAPSDSSRVYALIARPANKGSNGGFSPGGASTLGVYRSDDGGSTWTLRHPGNLQSDGGYYYNAIAVQPTDPDTFYIGGLPLLRSTDGGASYLDVTPPHVDIHGIGFDASGRLLVADDGGVHRSSDRGIGWQVLNNRLGTIQFYPGLSLHPDDPEIVLAGTQDNGSNKRASGGTWTSVFGGDGGYTAIDQTNPNNVFVEFQGTGNLFRSSNGGLGFVAASAGISAGDRNCFLPPFQIDPNNASRMLYATHRIYESTNQGLSWQPISGDLTSGAPWAIRALVIAPSNSSTVYAATNDGRVQVSSDGGRTWHLALSGLRGWPRVTRELAVDPLDDRTVYLAVNRFGVDQIRVSRDRGLTWSSIDGDLPDRPAPAVAVHNDGMRRLLFLGTDAGVYLSDNEGGSWSRYGLGLPNAPVHDLVVDAERARLVVTTLGRGAWTIALP